MKRRHSRHTLRMILPRLSGKPALKGRAELLNAQDDEEKDPVQPAVNKLKKRKRGKATAFLAIVAVTLIFGMGW